MQSPKLWLEFLCDSLGMWGNWDWEDEFHMRNCLGEKPTQVPQAPAWDQRGQGEADAGLEAQLCVRDSSGATPAQKPSPLGQASRHSPRSGSEGMCSLSVIKKKYHLG